MKRAIAVLLLLGSARAAAGPGEPVRSTTVIRAGKIYTVSGEILDRGLIVVENGRIVEVRPGGEIPAGATLVDALHQVVIPGLVDAQTTLADLGRDAEDSLTPEIRALDGYDFYQNHWGELSGGVTTVFLAPGSERLLTGQGAVVKTAGRDPRARVLSSSLGLRITLGEHPKNPPSIYRPPIRPSADHPLQPAQRQYPSSRMGEFAALRRASQAGPLHDPQRPLFVTAHNEDDIVKAVLFAQEIGHRIVLVDAEEAPRVADFLAEKKVPVIYNPAFVPGRRDLRDDARPSLEATGSLEGAAVLAKAGVSFALAGSDEADLRDLLFVAMAAVRSGLSPKEALASVTLVPAQILGVQDRVGSIAPGRDADLVFLSADPLTALASVERVMVGGEFVFERKASDVQTYRAVPDAGRRSKDLLALKGGRILTVTQGVLGEGMILVEGGKIAYVGRGRSIPPEAKILDTTGLTIVPGFLDLDSRLGFHVDATEQALHRARGAGPPSSIQAAAGSLIRPDDPALRAVAASGVTSIVLSPESSGISSVVKLSGESGAIVREQAAIKFTAQGGTANYESLKEAVQRGKRYVDEWDAYERARKEPPSAGRGPGSDPSKSADPITGTWKGALEASEPAVKAEFTAELKHEAGRVSGSFLSPLAGSEPRALEGSFENGELKLEGHDQDRKIELLMKITAPDHLKGTWKLSAPRRETKGTAEARREPPPAPLPPAPRPEVKEPRRDEALEPFRRLFAREIPAIVEVRDLPALENAVRVFRTDFSLDCMVLASDEVAFASDLLIERGVGVILGPGFIQDRKGAVVNQAEALASQGVPAAFASSALSATRHLPLLAAHAVRYGLDPFDALKALTVVPARLLKLDGRLGSIERGRDADLVILTGDPFLPLSRVRYVLIDGKIVFEGK
jgi:imidazolonepropionase-like amidohydrolase